MAPATGKRRLASIPTRRPSRCVARTRQYHSGPRNSSPSASKWALPHGRRPDSASDIQSQNRLLHQSPAFSYKPEGAGPPARPRYTLSSALLPINIAANTQAYNRSPSPRDFVTRTLMTAARPHESVIDNQERGTVGPRTSADVVDQQLSRGPILATFSTVIGILGPIGAAAAAILYAVLRIAHSEFYSPLGLTPEDVGLSQTAIIARATVMFGFHALLLTTELATAVLAYRLILPISRLSSHERRFDWPVVVCLLPGIALLVVLNFLVGSLFGSGVRRLWWGLAIPGVGVAASLALLIGVSEEKESATQRPITRRERWANRCSHWYRSLYGEQLRSMVRVIVYLMTALFVTWATIEAWRIAPQAGRHLRDTGELSSNAWYLDVLAAPARVIPRAADPLHVCGGERRAVLMGHRGGNALVLLVPPDGRGEVVPLAESDYVVVTGVQQPMACTTTSTTIAVP